MASKVKELEKAAEVEVETAQAAAIEAEEEMEEEEGDEEDEGAPEVATASTVAEPPVAIPDGFKGQRISVASAATTVDTLAKYVTHNDIPAAVSQFIDGGGVLVVNEKRSIFLHRDNSEWIIGALASLPSLREVFRPMVVAAVTATRNSDSYKALAAEYTASLERLNKLRNAMIEMTKSAAGAFSVEQYLDPANLFEIAPRVLAAGTGPKSGTGKRAKSARPVLPDYMTIVDGQEFHLVKVAEGWEAQDAAGMALARGDNHTEAGNALFDILRPDHANLSIPREFRFKEQNEWAEQGIDEQGRFAKIRGN